MVQLLVHVLFSGKSGFGKTTLAPNLVKAHLFPPANLIESFGLGVANSNPLVNAWDALQVVATHGFYPTKRSSEIQNQFV